MALPGADEFPPGPAASLDVQPNDFRVLGHRMVDNIADFLQALHERPVTPKDTPAMIRTLLPTGGLPQHGSDPGALLDEAASLMFDHSTFNGHPRFLGYITSSAAPIGALGDLLAAAVNPNVGGWALAPMATEIEAQTVRWIAELIGYPTSCGGILTSGGNMANFIGFLAGLRAKSTWGVRTQGMKGGTGGALRLYTSAETHTWVQKAADLFGVGTDAIRWIPTDEHCRMKTKALRDAIVADRAAGDQPFLVIGTAGSVMTGAVDALPELAAISREYKLWFHVDGAYGGFAAALPEASVDLLGLVEADSVAVDPHKWLYAPIEAGCALVRDAVVLRDTFSFHPPYYTFDANDDHIDYHEFGPQNTRGFRALKVWLALRQAGRDGYVRMISEDIAMANYLYQRVEATSGLEAWTRDLSIMTFRYVPTDLTPGNPATDAYLNLLNKELLSRLQKAGEVFLTNAIVQAVYLLRACVVNFRTSQLDMHVVPELVVEVGKRVDGELRILHLPKN